MDSKKLNKFTVGIWFDSKGFILFFRCLFSWEIYVLKSAVGFKFSLALEITSICVCSIDFFSVLPPLYVMLKVVEKSPMIRKFQLHSTEHDAWLGYVVA